MPPRRKIRGWKTKEKDRRPPPKTLHYGRFKFLLYLLKTAYAEFVDRVERIEISKGGKTELVIRCIEGFGSEFTLSQLHAKCAGVSRDMVRKVLKDLRKKGMVSSAGRGLGARWRRTGITLT